MSNLNMPDHQNVAASAATFSPAWNGVLKSGVSDRALRTYLVIQAYVRPGHGTFPKITRVAEDYGLSESYLRRGLAELVECELVLVDKAYFAGGFRRVNKYYFPHVPDPVSAGNSGHVTSDRPEARTSDTPQTRTGDTPFEVEEAEVEEVGSSSSEVASATPRPDVEYLCTLLADRVESNGAKRPTITKKWRDSARLLVDKDGYTQEQVAWIINWSQDNEFWRSNILSMPKLREKFEQLKLKSRASTQANRVAPSERMAETTSIGARLQAEIDRRAINA